MSRRIEIELTSDRGDGTWNWRAAGARQPRGILEGSLLPSGAKAGDVLRAEVEVDIEGTTVTSVASGPARERREPERIEIVGSGRRDDDQLVTTQLVGRRDRGDRGDRRDRRDRPPRREGEGGREGRDRRPRREGEAGREGRDGREGREGRDRRPSGPGGDRRDRRERRPAPPPLPERPKPKRLRPGRAHRKAVLADLSPEQQPIAEQVLKGGIPAVRAAIDAENDKRTAAGEPAINATELLGLAEQLLPRLRTADWRDRAEAALADAGELDLRDLRSVVVAADAAARDDETRALAAELRGKLDERVEAEQANWLEDLQLALGAGRVVRALRLSSRPPKAGTILPPDLRGQLTEAAGAALTADVGADRWAAVLDAAAYAPVRADVKPASVPETPGDDLVAAVKKYASRVPAVAQAFGIEAPARPSGRTLRPPKPPKRAGTVPVPKRDVVPGAIGAPVGAQPAPAAVEPEPGAARPAPAETAAAAEPEAVTAAAAPTPEPVQPSVAAAPVDVEPAGEGEPPAQPEPATTATADLGVAEAATPMEEVSAAPDADAAPADAEPADAEPVAEAAVTTGMPEAAVPVDPPDAGEPDADAGAAEALEAAPDVDDVSDGEPTP